MFKRLAAVTVLCLCGMLAAAGSAQADDHEVTTDLLVELGVCDVVDVTVDSSAVVAV